MDLTRFFLEKRKLANLIAIMIFLAGLLSIVSLPRQDSPNVNFNFVNVTTFYPGAAPEDVEINVTDKIEEELEKIDGIEQITSYSVKNMSIIFIQIDPNTTDYEKIRTDIQSSVDRVSDLPKEIEERPLVKELKSTDFPVMEIAITGAEGQESLMRKIVDDMESEIRNTTAAGTVDKLGYEKREVKIWVEEQKLNAFSISLLELVNAIQKKNVKFSAGSADDGKQEVQIITDAQIRDSLDVNNVIVRSNFSGKKVRVKDIALVKDDFKKKEMVYRTNGKNSINLIIKRRGITDVIDLSDQVRDIVARYGKLYLGQGIEVRTVADFSYYTRSLLNIVTNNALIGFFLVLITLFVFLNTHSAIWVAFGIPLSILGAYVFFPLFDITTNQISLVTIIMVLGMLVDDAIVVAENINRHHEMGKNYREAALDGTREVFWPVMATIATTLLCFSSIYFMKGIMGKFVMAIPTVVILTLLMSLFESVTILPVHLSYNRSKLKDRRQRWLKKLQWRYEKLLRNCLEHKKKTVAILVSLFISIVILFAALGRFELFPTEDFDFFYVLVETPRETSLQETSRRIKKLEEIINQVSPDLLMGFRTMVGSKKTDEAEVDPTIHSNYGLISVYLYPASQRNVRSEEIIEKLQEQMNHVEGFDKLEVRELKDGPPVGRPIKVRLVSDDFTKSSLYETEIMNFLKEIKGVKNIESSKVPGKNEFRIRLQEEKLKSLGVNVYEVANTLRIAYEGVVATSIRKNGEEIDFRVQLHEEERRDISTLKKLNVLNDQGQLIPLQRFIEFEEEVGDQTILHYNGERTIIVQGDVEEKVISASKVNQMIKDRFIEPISKTPGLSIVFGGYEKETMESFENFVKAFLLALICIYFVLVVLLDSFLGPLLIMIAIPFGVAGVLLAFLIHGLPLSFVGLIGTLGMIGVAVNDSLVMVTYLNSLKKERGDITTDLILEGAKTRLRPVILTTITTVVGLLPTVYGWGGSEPFIVPMVLAMSWGLAFSTIITLIIVPILYGFKVKDY